MKKLELTYTEIQEILERVLISPANGRPPLNKDYGFMFKQLSKERILKLQQLAQRCKRYEDAYKKCTNKFHWCLDHTIEYETYREDFARFISHYMPDDMLNSLEEKRKALQESHKNILKDCVKKHPCRWVNTCDTIEVHGLKLTRGLFYVGDYFKIPQSYKKIRAFDIRHREYREYNSNYKLSKLYGPVIQVDLPISQNELKKVPFSSYLDMHPTHRYEYLKWLAGDKTISEIDYDTFLFYLFGLQLRMFIDETTTDKERIEIIKYSIELYIQCQNENVYFPELVYFIDGAISKYFVNKLKELVPKDIMPHLTLCREALILFPYNNKGSIMENICRNTICILNYNDSIQKHWLTDSFYTQFADMVESELLKMSYEKIWKHLQMVINNPECHDDYKQYCINSPKDYSMLLYDFIFNFKLFPNIYSVKFFNQCINNCFKRIVKRISEYNTLISELPLQVSSSISLFETKYQNIHTKIHRIITEGEDFATIEKETSATEYTIDEVVPVSKQRVLLNNERLAKVEKQTKQAQDLLSDIFEDNGDNTNSIAHENNVFRDVLNILLTKESWKRNEVENLCKERHLMLGSVLEQINDYSYGKIEDAIIEDDGDTIYVMTDYKEKLI